MKALSVEFRMAWATRLRQAMESRGMKVEDLANACKRSLSIVYRWQSGQIPELPEVKVLAEILGRDPAWLLWGESGKKETPARSRPHKLNGLWLALSVGAALLWPSGSTSAEVLRYPSTSSLTSLHLIGTWRRFRNLLNPLGLGMVYA